MKFTVIDLTTKNIGDIISDNPNDFQEFCDSYLGSLITQYLHHKARLLGIRYEISWEPHKKEEMREYIADFTFDNLEFPSFVISNNIRDALRQMISAVLSIRALP